MFTYPLLGGGPTFAESAFEALVASHSPIMHHTFQDATFTTLTDVSGNGYDATPIGAGVAVEGASLRPGTMARSWQFPYRAVSASDPVTYRVCVGGVAPASLMYGTQNNLIQTAYMRSTTRDASSQVVAGCMEPDIGTLRNLYQYVSSGDLAGCQERHTSGALSPDSSPATVSDGTPHIVSALFSVEHGIYGIWLDGVAYNTAAYGATLGSNVYGYYINPRYASTNDQDVMNMDHHAVWTGGAGAVPSPAEIVAMHTAYLAEVI